MNNTTFILLTLLVICWTLNPFLKKMMGSRLPANENMIFNHSLCTIIIVIYTIYLLINQKCDISKIQSLNKKDIMLGIVTSVITVASSLLLIKILQENEASQVMPQIQPSVLLLTLIIGYFIFNEKMTKNKIMGAGLITIGLFIINKKD
tara:strand:- start:1468 stop:1914 length:447 start_codon:yes stop_codon:yes gene_type:complete